MIVEPYPGNMGLVLPRPGYLQTLRELCSRNGALLIFDEVITGFRVARGGAQAREGIMPDLTTLGKVIGGGLPVGAFGGRADVMAQLSPDGPVYQAGTLSGNPLAMAAGLATLGIIAADATLYDRLEALTRRLTGALDEIMTRHGVAHVCNSARFDVYDVLHERARYRSAERSAVGSNEVREIFRRHAGSRRLLRALAVRGELPVDGAHGTRDRPDRHCGRRVAVAARRCAGTLMPITCIGLSHHTAPVEVRERHAFPASRMAEALVALRDYEAVQEAVMLQTCGRLEIYAELARLRARRRADQIVPRELSPRQRPATTSSRTSTRASAIRRSNISSASAPASIRC